MNKKMTPWRLNSDLTKLFESGNLQEIRSFIISKHSNIEVRNKHFNAIKNHGLRLACEKGQLDIIQFLLTSPDLIETGLTFADLHVDQEYGFRLACENGHFEIIKYLLTSDELVKAGHSFPDLHACDESGIRWACENGHLNVIKYLLTSPELKSSGHTWANVHAKNDWAFRVACDNSHTDVLRWLIIDYGITKTPDIESIIKSNEEAQKLFLAREELQLLNESINDSRAIDNTKPIRL